MKLKVLTPVVVCLCSFFPSTQMKLNSLIQYSHHFREFNQKKHELPPYGLSSIPD